MTDYYYDYDVICMYIYIYIYIYNPLRPQGNMHTQMHSFC